MDPASAPPPDAPPWAAWDEPEPDPPARRPPWLLLVGVVPWVVLALVLVGRGRGGAGDAALPPAEAIAAATASPAPVVAPRLLPVPADAGSTTGRVVTAGARVAPDAGDAAAVATVVARAWLTGVGPRLDLPGLSAPQDTYAEHLVVEAVDHPAPGAAVVTLLALVLHADGQAYERAEVRRIAVPLWFDEGGARPAGTPWALPAPDLEIASSQVSEAITDPEVLAAAGEALVAAGYAVDEVVSLGRVDGWPLVVTALATAPGHDAPTEHVLWLREHLGGLIVAGSRPAPTPTTEVAP